MGMNVWAFTGHIGRDAETRHTPGGDAVVQFSVAVTSGYGDKQKTTWVRCALWGKRGEAVLQYLVKGQLVGITGEVTLREFDDKDGARRASLEVRVADLSLLGKRDENTQNSARSASTPKQKPAFSASEAQSGFDDMDDDIPF